MSVLTSEGYFPKKLTKMPLRTIILHVLHADPFVLCACDLCPKRGCSGFKHYFISRSPDTVLALTYFFPELLHCPEFVKSPAQALKKASDTQGWLIEFFITIYLNSLGLCLITKQQKNKINTAK